MYIIWIKEFFIVNIETYVSCSLPHVYCIPFDLFIPTLQLENMYLNMPTVPSSDRSK